MNWIVFFTTQKISYYVYKLNKGDRIVLKNRYNKDNKITIVLTGIIALAKIFCNKELLPLAILGKNDIIDNNIADKTFYQIIALQTTYIVILNEKNLYQHKIRKVYGNEIIKCYQQTTKKYEETISIVTQRNKTKRVLLFILIMFLRFGNINKHKIIIPFKLTNNYTAIMTGTGIETVNKITKKVYVHENTKISFIHIKNLKLI
uniref:Global nitrogen transcriptional regulator n=1 Tax=Polysiphonia infestans TaxID=2006978 RepID=A0A1Z1MFB2_9FLOR|nr:global nitrogen transcriptional regulator [Polysiphonia infestans]ARW64451.1 global nitrogen transcriptional regulator [Polysiphonia infestans]